MAITGVGATILPAISVQRELEHHELLRVPIVGLEMPLALSLIWYKEKQFSPVVQAFREMLRSEMREKNLAEQQSDVLHSTRKRLRLATIPWEACFVILL